MVLFFGSQPPLLTLYIDGLVRAEIVWVNSLKTSAGPMRINDVRVHTCPAPFDPLNFASLIPDRHSQHSGHEKSDCDNDAELYDDQQHSYIQLLPAKTPVGSWGLSGTGKSGFFRFRA